MPDTKQRTTVYITPEVIQTAKSLGVNLSAAAERGMRAAIQRQKVMNEVGKQFDKEMKI